MIYDIFIIGNWKLKITEWNQHFENRWSMRNSYPKTENWNIQKNKMTEIEIKYSEKIWSMILIIRNWKLNWQNEIIILRIDDTFEIPSWKLKTENYSRNKII
jgi:hypothetical protein